MSKLQIGDYVRDNDGREDRYVHVLRVEAIKWMPVRGHRASKCHYKHQAEHAILSLPGYEGSRRTTIALHRIYIDGKPRRQGWSLSNRHGERIDRRPAS